MQHSDSLRTGHLGLRIPVGEKVSSSAHTFRMNLGLVQPPVLWLIGPLSGDKDAEVYCSISVEALLQVCGRRTGQVRHSVCFGCSFMLPQSRVSWIVVVVRLLGLTSEVPKSHSGRCVCYFCSQVPQDLGRLLQLLFKRKCGVFLRR